MVHGLSEGRREYLTVLLMTTLMCLVEPVVDEFAGAASASPP